MNDKIEYTCETCKKKIKTLKKYNECFNKNHEIRCKGLFIVDSSYQNNVVIQKGLGTCIVGIALTNAKAGEEIIVRIK